MGADLQLRILGLIAQRDRIGVGNVVRELGASRSSAYRALRSLEEAGMLLLSPTGRGYGPGPSLVALTEVHAIEPAARRRRSAALDAIRDATGETVHASILVGSQVVAIDGRGSPTGGDMGSRIGMTAPANAMAAGKLLLAALDDRLIHFMVPDSVLPRRTPRTISDPSKLLQELEQIRRDGFATALQESEEGVDSVAIPLDGTTMRDRVAAVVSVPSERGGIPRLRRLAVAASRVVREARDVHPWPVSRR